MKKIALAAALVACSSMALADIEAEVSVVSDYREYGVTWTDNRPALQAGIEYAHDSGFYIGTWGSSVDFADWYDEDDDEVYKDKTKLEWEFFAGYEYEFHENFSAALEIATIHYFGESDSSDGDYQEYKGIFTFFEDTELTLGYTSDYSGSEMKNYLVAVSQDFAIGEDYNLNITLSRNESDDYLWDEKHKYYHGAQISLDRDWKGFNFMLAASTTTIDEPADANGKSALIFGITKNWSW